MAGTGELAADTSGIHGYVPPVRRKPKIWVGGPVPPGADAITLGRLIIVRRSAADDEQLLRHESEHVRQWHEFGVVGFLARYLGAYFRWRLRGYGHWAAYRRIPFEVEAEWVARREVRR